MNDPEQDRAEAFRMAGVPKTYHKTGLRDVPNTEHLLGYVQEELVDDLAEGRGLILDGAFLPCEDALFHITKSILVRGYAARVYTLLEFCDEMMEEDPDFWSAEAVLITAFEVHEYETNPLPREKKQRFEDTFMQVMRLEKPVFVHRDPPAEWWPAYLIAELQRRTRRFTL